MRQFLTRGVLVPGTLSINPSQSLSLPSQISTPVGSETSVMSVTLGVICPSKVFMETSISIQGASGTAGLAPLERGALHLAVASATRLCAVRARIVMEVPCGVVPFQERLSHLE